MEEIKPLLTHRYATYKRRWFMLSVVMIYNISNAMIWISYASIANVASIYYNVSEDKVNWFSLVFFFFSVVCALPAFWLIDTYGLRTGLLIGTWINASGCIVRLLASFVVHLEGRFWVALAGQAICSCSQPIILAIPTKLAALWFADNERTLANTFASLANPLGVLIASALSPIIVKEPTDIKLMLLVFSVPAILGAFMTTFGVCSDAPPTPPSASAHLISEPFFKGVKMALKSRSFILLMFVFGFGVALFSTITSLLEQIICPKGYNNDIAGLCGALVIVGGLIFSGVASVYVDRTKRFEETAKVMMLLAAIVACLLLVSTSLFNQTALLCVVFFLFGGTCLGVAPICLELGVECTYPVDEATSSGLQWMFGQFIGVFLMICLPELGTKLTPEEQLHSVCDLPGSSSKLDSKDLSKALIATTAILIVIVLSFVFGFKAEYKRLYAEIEAKATKSFYSDSADGQEVNDFVQQE